MVSSCPCKHGVFFFSWGNNQRVRSVCVDARLFFVFRGETDTDMTRMLDFLLYRVNGFHFQYSEKLVDLSYLRVFRNTENAIHTY